MQERFCGGFGQAYLDSPQGRTSLAVRNTISLNEAVLFSTYPEIGTTAEQQAFQILAAQVRLTRYGLDCYAYGLLAAGHIDLVVEAGLKPYDIQAPIAVIQAAGGIVSSWTGGPAHEGGRVLAAATPELHAAALSFLSDIGTE